MEILLYIYLGGLYMSAAMSAIILLSTRMTLNGVDNFWDWVIYNIFWFVYPIKLLTKNLIKALIKFVKNTCK